jgi:hypothetical protein
MAQTEEAQHQAEMMRQAFLEMQAADLQAEAAAGQCKSLLIKSIAIIKRATEDQRRIVDGSGK